MMLFINTSRPEETSFYLLDKAFLTAHIWDSSRTQQEKLHSELIKFLNKSRVKIEEIKKLGVVTGPGHFSRVRTGVVTANTLAYALNIPVVGVPHPNNEPLDFSKIINQKGSKSVNVYYDKAPNITKPKKKK